MAYNVPKLNDVCVHNAERLEQELNPVVQRVNMKKSGMQMCRRPSAYFARSV